MKLGQMRARSESLCKSHAQAQTLTKVFADKHTLPHRYAQIHTHLGEGLREVRRDLDSERRHFVHERADELLQHRRQVVVLRLPQHVQQLCTKRASFRGESHKLWSRGSTDGWSCDQVRWVIEVTKANTHVPLSVFASHFLMGGRARTSVCPF